MTVTLTPHAEELLYRLAHGGPPEQIVERALERLVADEPDAAKRMTPKEAVERIRELRKGLSLGGLSIKELVNEGRKY